MKTTLEVHAAHDRLVAILLKEVPNPFDDDPQAERMLIAATDVLCWVLEHDHNLAFTENLQKIDAFLAERGLVLRDGGKLAYRRISRRRGSTDMSEENQVLVCMSADAPLMAEGSTLVHRCATCKQHVMMAPSGQQFLKQHPEAEIMCFRCWLMRPS